MAPAGAPAAAATSAPAWRAPRTRARCRALARPPPCSASSAPPDSSTDAAPPRRAPPPPPRPLPALLDAPRAFVEDRQRADSRFLQKVCIEVSVDSACTLAAELVARGAAAFGAEWVYVVDDLVTTVLLDVAMVSILAPSAAKNAAASEPCELSGDALADAPQVAPPLQPGGDAPAGRPQPPAPDLRAELGARWARFAAAATCELEALPNSAFAAAPPPPHPGYTPQQRVAAAAWTALLYGALGLACGGAGQALTNALTRVAPAVGPAALPGVLPVALLWSRYMATSASLRYQLVGAAENVAERTPGLGSNGGALAAVSLFLRLCNNVYGAGLFVEMMKDSGISP